ncbi:MAG: integrase [Roseovarius sp. BRH_c41]|uniref:tyrosine-type recombinase/integrase n=1 Tax=Roseovarius sp. BRH_c41 TaxID=1629709 RepID=UPI0005F27314|nr:tyrosine-type recombinase/integrase [Roseovarius sp. BRH_c41]KJS45207.1 MAG: integrase [Roseovarius sp. BRH_c41]
MVKRDLPKHVYLKGRNRYPYFIRGNVCMRIQSEPGSNAFWAEYNRLLNGNISREPQRTVKKLIAHYMQSHKWARLAPNTQKSYRQSFRYLEDRIGLVDPASIRRRHVIEMRDALSATPTTANRRVGAMSILLEHGIDIDWLERNPAKGVESLAPTKTRHPWPADMVEAFRATTDGQVLLLFELLIGTGQRISDVLAMQWGHIDGAGIAVRQGKTKAEVWIPFTARLSAALRATPKRGMHLVTQSDGRPVSYKLAWKWIKEARDNIGAQAWDIHSLRHTAASELAAIGLDDQHIMSITGHSSSGMVRLYAGKAAQRARAEKAQAERNKNGS